MDDGVGIGADHGVAIEIVFSRMRMGEALSESVATQLATKVDLADLKLDVIKWMVGLALAQISLLVGILVKLL